jgi:hypothetical protein
MSCYSAIFREGNNTKDSNSIIKLASGMTLYEFDREKSKSKILRFLTCPRCQQHGMDPINRNIASIQSRISYIPRLY